MEKKIELEGYLYIIENEYDEETTEEVCLDNDSRVFFEETDSYSLHYFQFKDCNFPAYQKDPKIKIKSPTTFSSIIKNKLKIKPDKIKCDGFDIKKPTTFSFNPDRKKVKITIEEIEDSP